MILRRIFGIYFQKIKVYFRWDAYLFYFIFFLEGEILFPFVETYSNEFLSLGLVHEGDFEYFAQSVGKFRN